MTDSRDENTDLLRAIAIVMVLIHHLGQFLLFDSDMLNRYLSLGAIGVDLFFVLSGWLIGGLYWREHLRFGRVNITRFWLRRWLRTLPPYLAVLPIAWLTVYLYRNEPFDPAYLIFAQNYEDRIPYFLVSWSLCVEEHFYLMLPVTLLAIYKLRISFHFGFIVLLIAAALARTIDPAASFSAQFGYPATASHLNMTGMLAGVYLAYLRQTEAMLFAHMCRWARVACLPTVALLLTVPLWGDSLTYHFAGVLAALAFSSCLIATVNRPAFTLARIHWVKRLALWSYSIYLTHAIVINAGGVVSDRLGISRTLLIPALVIAIAFTGWVLFVVVERSAMQQRDRWVPRATAA